MGPTFFEPEIAVGPTFFEPEDDYVVGPTFFEPEDDYAVGATFFEPEDDYVGHFNKWWNILSKIFAHYDVTKSSNIKTLNIKRIK